MAADFTIKQYDTLPAITAILKVAGVVIPDLASAASVKLVLALQSDPDTYVFSGTATVVDAPEGEVAYNWQAGDTDDAGEYFGEWHITYNNGAKRTVPTVGKFRVSIEPRLPATPPP